MRKRYIVSIIILIAFLAGLISVLLNRFYTLDYIYKLIIKREFAVNPRVEINPEREYLIRLWHHPFYRTIKEVDEREFFQELKKDIEAVYPNIRLFTGEVDFAAGEEKLREAIREGNPPDIYFNTGTQVFIEEDLQIAVSPYLDKQERESYYTVDWQSFGFRDRLWGWPVLVCRQYWIGGKDILGGEYRNLPFLEQLFYLKEDSLLLNYYDESLLKQLLALVGLEKFKMEKGELDPDSHKALEEVFLFLHGLREKGVLYKDTKALPNIFLKKLLEDKSVLIGPVNPYLSHFITERLGDEVEFIYLDNLVKTYELYIFRQKDYKGDDHSRAVMEAARIFSRKTAGILAEKLGLAKAFLDGEGERPEVKELPVIHPEYKDYWEEVVWPAWLEFWEQNLSPAEVMNRF